MDTSVKIRKFAPQDRAVVRQICCDVADRGEPIDGFFPYRDVAADLLTSYYTDYEPQASFVVEEKDKVIAYINGSCDNRRYGVAMFFIIIPLALIKALKKGVMFRQNFWRMVAVMVSNWPRLFQWRKESFHSHQGHLHIGILKEYRHRHVGQALVEALCQEAKINGTKEMAASVHDDNTPACQFFKKMGFELRDTYPMAMSRGEITEQYQSLLYVKDLV